MEYIVKYVKNTYPNKTFAEFLQYIGYGKLDSNDYMMVDYGNIRSVSMTMDADHTYYFHGFRLKDRNKEAGEVRYLSKSVCIITCYKKLADANLVYLKK